MTAIDSIERLYRKLFRSSYQPANQAAIHRMGGALVWNKNAISMPEGLLIKCQEGQRIKLTKSDGAAIPCQKRFPR
jgi:hypothetical protein